MSKRRVSRAVAADIRSGVPEATFWTADEVAEWIDNRGFPQYKECFRSNFVTGRRLIAVDAVALPSMGVTDFEDIKKITQLIRDLLGIPKFPSKREVRMRDPKIAYLELKRRTGDEMDNTTFNQFVFENLHFFPQSKGKFGRKSFTSY